MSYLTVLVHSCCYNEMPQTRWLKNNRNFPFERCSPSWDPHLRDPGDRGAGGHEVRDESERLVLVRGFDAPPDDMAARLARRERGAVAQAAVEAVEGGEDHAALVRLVAVLDEEARHAQHAATRGAPRHRANSLIVHPDPRV